MAQLNRNYSLRTKFFQIICTLDNLKFTCQNGKNCSQTGIWSGLIQSLDYAYSLLCVKCCEEKKRKSIDISKDKRIKILFGTDNTPRTGVGSGYRDKKLAVKSRKYTCKSNNLNSKKCIILYILLLVGSKYEFPKSRN